MPKTQRIRQVSGDELRTPETIRRLPSKLYLEAKAEPAFRFYRSCCTGRRVAH